MRIGVFGSTGTTGLLLTEYALQQGHEVYALARTPSKLQLPSLSEEKLKKLHIVQGDISNQVAVEEVVAKTDVVIETLGASVNRKTTIKEDGAKAIIAAMKKLHKTRFVALTSISIHKDVVTHEPWIKRAIVGLLLNHIMNDLGAMRNVILAESDWLDFTIVEPPQLVPLPPVGEYNISVDFPAGVGQVTFADLALAMLDCAVTGKHSKQVVGMNGTLALRVGYKEMEKARTVVWTNFMDRIVEPGAKLGIVAGVVALAYVAARKLQATYPQWSSR